MPGGTKRKSCPSEYNQHPAYTGLSVVFLRDFIVLTVIEAWGHFDVIMSFTLLYKHV